ncbi:outer membrane protein assembly factor BamB family protein [Actinoplanes derwentensis]|uniref:PQQ-like domain-containing protein n=1 Tax=Actinoplanes derwentensis TaxID=113562 RepID=A0A1H2B9J9_9ACTN|nr:PQQ-binding-like beta-propeller repeat protein [Actinoplanes derwentensis]GID86478.1 hypothetical protein Ade03nite_54020 [Actinoplanes derwentensis]SDT54883.1 PQQ-like domain-containing protein [Actinoplanes derwentensis]
MGESVARDVASSEATRAVESVLREAGGGRLAGVRIGYEGGRRVHVVQFARGGWLCAATVDALTGEVTEIRDEGLPFAGPEFEPTAGPESHPVTARLDFRTVWDVRTAWDDESLAHVATDAGVGVVRLSRDFGWTLVVEDHHTTGYGATRHVAPVPGGVVAATGDGRVFRLDGAGRVSWENRLSGAPYGINVDLDGRRALIATDRGTVELDTRTGTHLESLAGPVRAAAYLPGGDRVLAGHRGDLVVVDATGAARWRIRLDGFTSRIWTRGERIYTAGEGGLREIVAGEGIVARWSAPSTGSAENAVVIGDAVFTCSGGSRLDRHGYATAAYHGRADVFAGPEAVTALSAGGRRWLLAGHRDGLLSARAV